MFGDGCFSSLHPQLLGLGDGLGAVGFGRDNSASGNEMDSPVWGGATELGFGDGLVELWDGGGLLCEFGGEVADVACVEGVGLAAGSGG